MPTIEQRAHDNLCGFVRVQARLHAADVLDEPGILAFHGSVDFPAIRMAIRSGPEIDAAAFAARVGDFLLTDGTTAAVFARTDTDSALIDALTGLGFIEYSNAPEMACEARLPDRAPEPGVTVRLATTADDVRAYADIAAHAFTHLMFPEDITRDTIDHPDVMLDPRVVIALAAIDGRDVAGASAFLVGDAGDGYVGWVSCLDDARGHGLGDVVTRAVTNEAFDRGASVVTLEASPFGESTYARMGYREIYRYATLIKL